MGSRSDVPPVPGVPREGTDLERTVAVTKSTGDGWITAPQVAKLLGLQLNTIYRLIDTGELEAEQGARTVWKRNGQVGERRRVRIRRQAVDDYLERARVKPGELTHLFEPPTGRYLPPRY